MNIMSIVFAILFSTSVLSAFACGLIVMRGMHYNNARLTKKFFRLRTRQIGFERRRMASQPNIICSLPMHDIPRREVPLY